MVKGKYIRALGLMSGTSMDGVDAALLEAQIDARGIPHMSTLGAYSSIPFPQEVRDAIHKVLGRESHDTDTYKIESKLGEYYLHATQMLIAQAGFTAKDIDLIGLHGQTITHRPEGGFTWQLGDGPLLARQTGIDVVYDFRTQDIAAGGQGAPLAPIFHQALAQAGFIHHMPVAIVNIGGVGNITLLDQQHLRAYDTGPGNGCMDDYCQQMLGIPYDTDGKIAASGSVQQDILRQFLTHPYFTASAPKSLDRQDFHHQIVSKIPASDALRTLSACSAAAIAQAVETERRFAPKLQTVLITGGGRLNTTLINEIRHRLPEYTIETLDNCYPELSGDALESWAFAWLAILYHCKQPASFPSTTGVTTAQCAGVLAPSA